LISGKIEIGRFCDSKIPEQIMLELDAFLQSRVKSGQYQTTSEVVREALRLLERQERWQAGKRAHRS
jgi:Arc/MetJ-type ribon-helix-helix transcriptional regulator